MALARKMGWDRQAEYHLADINQWHRTEVVAYLDEVFAVFEERGQYSWKLDITWLDGKGVTLPSILDRDANPI